MVINMYYVYILRCIDNSLYTGITTDIKRRINEHITKDKKCAKYTKNHDVIKLEALFTCENKHLAAKLEYHIKQLTKKEKELIIKDNKNLCLLKDKLDILKYTREEVNDVKI